MSVPDTIAVQAPAASAVQRPSAWVRGPVWDGVWMLNALWLVPIALWLAHGYSDPEASPLDAFYFGLTALFWIGHRLGSTWLAYCTEAYRPLLRSEPVRFVLLPLLVTGACFAIFLPPDDALPWTRGERFVGMAILDYALVTYHFAAQHFGALSLYRTRAERARCAQTRRHDRIFALGVGGALIFLADILAGAVAYPDLWINRWLIPGWVASNQDAIREAAMLVLFVATSFMLIAEARAPRRSLPRVLYILGLAAMVTIALQPRSLFLYVAIWTAQHWILATGLASQTPGGEPAPASGNVRRVLHALNVRPWAVLLVLGTASVLLLPLFEVEANLDLTGGAFYGDRIFGAAAEQLRTSSWVPGIVAIAFATGFVHYLLDRNVFRMSDPRVRAAARGLLDPPRM
ncbi:MAG TPA: hypothetical protein VEW08_09470 [Steroidobacteraceae bacterium]|nr:hypothetical protein [Steroidobacteraceae bacterium]